MTRDKILELMKRAGWTGGFTRIPDETTFETIPLEMEQIERFVELILGTRDSSE
jgi:hypothetical protein